MPSKSNTKNLSFNFFIIILKQCYNKQYFHNNFATNLGSKLVAGLDENS